MAATALVARTISLSVIHTFAVSCPRAVVAGRGVGTAAATTTTDALDQLVTEAGNGRLELAVALSIPLGALSGDGIAAGEGNVENVVLVVARVAVDTLSVASGGQRDGSLSNHGLLVVVTILVTPNTIDLQKRVSLLVKSE